MIQYNPPDDLNSLFDLDMESGAQDDPDPIFPSLDGLETPKLDIASPLAQKRLDKTNRVSTEEVD